MECSLELMKPIEENTLLLLKYMEESKVQNTQ